MGKEGGGAHCDTGHYRRNRFPYCLELEEYQQIYLASKVWPEVTNKQSQWRLEKLIEKIYIK